VIGRGLVDVEGSAEDEPVSGNENDVVLEGGMAGRVGGWYLKCLKLPKKRIGIGTRRRNSML
jgi:hypothetical protein